MGPDEWINRFAAEVGLEPPDDAEVKLLLELAAEAAHSSARTAAPIACWIAGRTGKSAAELMDAAKRAGEE
jgi:hypothetical protein